MKILVVGGNGTIGKKIVETFSKKETTIIAGRNSANVVVDIGDSNSILNMFEKIGNVDAIICACGEAKWDYLEHLSEDDFYIGIKSKLMGQVNLVRHGQAFLNKGGSFTLTTGILADDPVPKTTSAAMVNGALHSFVKAAALEMKHGQRINVISSGLVQDAYERYKDYFPGHNPIAMEKMANGYVRSVYGKGNGEIIRIYD